MCRLSACLTLLAIACGGSSTEPDPELSELAGVGMSSDGNIHTLRARTEPPDDRPTFNWIVRICQPGFPCRTEDGSANGPFMSASFVISGCPTFDWSVSLTYIGEDFGTVPADSRSGTHEVC